MTLCERLAAHFSARPGQWIDANDLMQVAGRMGWRTRASELRQPPYSMTIENRLRKVETMLGETVTVSEYRWLPVSGPSGCVCASLGDDAPCGWCDGPDREGSAHNAR